MRRVKFQDGSKSTNIPTKASNNNGGSAGRQLVPGLLLVQQDNKGTVLICLQDAKKIYRIIFPFS